MHREEFLPYALPLIEDDDIHEVIDSLKSGWLSKGKKTIEFEKRFADYVGVKHAIAMNSCTAALHTSLLSGGIKAGDEIITTPMTFASTANTILHAGARPVFVDIDPVTGCINPDRIEEKIVKNTKAIIPVHYGGQVCDMDRIMDIARRHNLYVSEDAAHAVYAAYKGKLIGGIGDAASFSFYATKNLVTGEGGMLTTNNDEIAEKARLLSCHGMSKNAWMRYGKGGSWYYEILVPGYKYNMFDIQASLGLRQLDKLERMQIIREEYARIYNEAFKDIPEITTPTEIPGNRHSWHLYVIQIKDELLKINRDEFINELTMRNIGTSVHFIPIHLQPYYRETYGYKKGDFPVAERMFERIISLPLYPRMKKQDVEDVIDAVREIVEGNRK